MSDVCPNCHMSYGWDGHECTHCQIVSGIAAVGTAATTASALLSLQQQLVGDIGAHHVADCVAEMAGESLNTLGEAFGEHLGELLASI